MRTPQNLQNLGLITNHHGVWTAAWDQKYKERSWEKVWSYKRQLPFPHFPFLKPWDGFFSSYCQHNWLNKLQSKQDFQGNSLSLPFFLLVELCYHNTDAASNASWESTQNWNSALVSWWLQRLIFYFLLCLKLWSLKLWESELNFSNEPIMQRLKHTRLREVLYVKNHHEQPSQNKASTTLHKHRFVAFHTLGRELCCIFAKVVV